MMSKYLYTSPKHIVSASQTVRFSLRNGPFCVLKQAVLERKMACISKPLIISVVQRRPHRWNNMNYFNNLLPVFSCCFLTLLNNLDTKKGMVIAIPFYFNPLLLNLINSFVVSRTLLTFWSSGCKDPWILLHGEPRREPSRGCCHGERRDCAA